MELLYEAIFYVAIWLIIVFFGLKIRRTAMEGREKKRRPMNSFMFVDQGGPYDWKIVDIGSPMDVALGWVDGEDKQRNKK